MPLPDRRALAAALDAIVPGARIVEVAPVGADAAGAGVARKGAGYATAFRVVLEDAARRRRVVCFRTASPDAFGHDRRADRAALLLLAYDGFGAIPGHVAALDVGFLAPEGLRSLRGAGEPYLVTEWAEGRLYAEDLRRVARERVATPLDLARAEALAGWLSALHETPVDDPVAWRRALRDLVGAGEGIFGVADAYGPDVPAAPPARLAAIERRCVEWRWRLAPRAERLRRTHGDFHPFNLLFEEGGTRLVPLDASRGGRGDPADDLVALTVNYPFFALQAEGAWERGLGPLWRRCWGAYLAARGPGVLEAVAPYLAWRALVLACPAFYPDLRTEARDRLLGFAEAALDRPAFAPGSVEELFR